MNKMTLVHIGLFTAGVFTGWMLAKNKKNFANLTKTLYHCKDGIVCNYSGSLPRGVKENMGTGNCSCNNHGGVATTSELLSE